jgi:exodeoxyribonuclease VII small subunit
VDDPDTAQESFEAALTRLEGIVQRLERSDVPLDDALRLFEEGLATVRIANTTLSTVEARVAQLVDAADGALVTVDFPGMRSAIAMSGPA